MPLDFPGRRRCDASAFARIAHATNARARTPRQLRWRRRRRGGRTGRSLARGRAGAERLCSRRPHVLTRTAPHRTARYRRVWRTTHTHARAACLPACATSRRGVADVTSHTAYAHTHTHADSAGQSAAAGASPTRTHTQTHVALSQADRQRSVSPSPSLSLPFAGVRCALVRVWLHVRSRARACTFVCVFACVHVRVRECERARVCVCGEPGKI